MFSTPPCKYVCSAGANLMTSKIWALLRSSKIWQVSGMLSWPARNEYKYYKWIMNNVSVVSTWGRSSPTHGKFHIFPWGNLDDIYLGANLGLVALNRLHLDVVRSSPVASAARGWRKNMEKPCVSQRKGATSHPQWSVMKILSKPAPSNFCQDLQCFKSYIQGCAPVWHERNNDKYSALSQHIDGVCWNQLFNSRKARRHVSSTQASRQGRRQASMPQIFHLHC